MSVMERKSTGVIQLTCCMCWNMIRRLGTNKQLLWRVNRDFGLGIDASSARGTRCPVALQWRLGQHACTMEIRAMIIPG